VRYRRQPVTDTEKAEAAPLRIGTANPKGRHRACNGRKDV